MNEERKDTSKQVLLSVLGVAILIVAVVGISFAAFTYTRAGERENIVTTGTVEMDYTETTKGINITNAIPMSEAKALAAYKGDITTGDGQNYNTAASGQTSENDNVFDFTVSAKIAGDNQQFDYDITAKKDNDTNKYCTAKVYEDAKKIGTADEDTTTTYFEAEGSDPAVVGIRAAYAKCTLVSDDDIRLWIGEATSAESNKYITEIASAPTIADSEYTAKDLNGVSKTGKSAPWTLESNTARGTGAPAAEMMLVGDKFTATGTRYYRFKMWVSQDYVVDSVARTYKVEINVYSKDHVTANEGSYTATGTPYTAP